MLNPLYQPHQRLFSRSHGTWVAVSLTVLLATACANMDVSQFADGTPARAAGAATDLAASAQGPRASENKPSGDKTNDNKSNEMGDECFCMTCCKSNISCKNSGKNHSDNSTKSMTWKNIKCVIKRSFSSKTHSDIADDRSNSTDKNTRAH